MNIKTSYSYFKDTIWYKNYPELFPNREYELLQIKNVSDKYKYCVEVKVADMENLGYKISRPVAKKENNKSLYEAELIRVVPLSQRLISTGKGGIISDAVLYSDEDLRLMKISNSPIDTSSMVDLVVLEKVKKHLNALSITNLINKMDGLEHVDTCVVKNGKYPIPKLADKLIFIVGSSGARSDDDTTKFVSKGQNSLIDGELILACIKIEDNAK